VVFAIQNLNGVGIGTGSSLSNGTGYTAIEVQKYDLLSHRFGGSQCTNVIPIVGNPPYGMKMFTPGKCYATGGANGVKPDFGVPGSPWQYLQQIGNAGGSGASGTDNSACETDLFSRICGRVRQIDPQITPAQVQAALSTMPLNNPIQGGYNGLDLNETLYLHVPGPNVVRMDIGTAGDYFQPTLALDGASSAAVFNCENQYNLASTVVNAKKNGVDSCAGHGDADFHDQPFTQGPGNLPGIDRAVWTPASGWRNLLGEVQFQNEATGAGQFCKPN